MKRLSLSFLFILSYSICFAKNIRVLLAEYDFAKTHRFNIDSSDGFFLKKTPSSKKTYFLIKNKLNFLIKNKHLYIRGKNEMYKKIHSPKSNHISSTNISIYPKKKYLWFEGKPFQGTFTIASTNKKIFLINRLSLENYVYSVLPYELFQSWPLELHKVQAIASRTYAVYCINNNRRKQAKRPYDIKKTKIHQTYNGTHPHTHLMQAIRETEGKILTYNNNVIMAMFDSCCAGIKPSQIDGIYDFEKAPYLARKQACTFCKNCKLYSWEKKLPFDRFLQHITKNHYIANRLKNIDNKCMVNVSKRDRAGIVQNISFRTNKKIVELGGKCLRNRLRTFFRSLHFSLEKKDNLLVVKGKGYGHMIGFCQYGGYELVNRNWSYKNILRFYYPKTRFATLV